MADDKIEQCARSYRVVSTGFLDTAEQSVLRKHYHHAAVDCRIHFFGGYEDAERVVLLCQPEYTDPGEREAVFSVIRAVFDPRSSASARSGRPPAHSDYLGSLLGLGIDRSKVGDILVREDGADIIVLSEIVPFILQEYTSAGRAPLTVTAHPLSELIIPERETITKHDTVASLRLDNVVSSIFGLSRSKAATAIRQGLVSLDHIETIKIDTQVTEDALISFRGKGRARLTDIGGKSKKGRINITFTK